MRGCRPFGAPLRTAEALQRAGFGALALVAAQTEADAGRLRACGAPEVMVSGNLKFDIAPPADQLELAQTFRGWRGARRTILAASTREGEEIPLLAAFMQYRRPGDLLILVPRHPSASPRWRHWPGHKGLPVALRSAAKTIEAATEVWIGDSMGRCLPTTPPPTSPSSAAHGSLSADRI